MLRTPSFLVLIHLALGACATARAPEPGAGAVRPHANPWPGTFEDVPPLNPLYVGADSRRRTVVILGASSTRSATERFEEWAAGLAAHVVRSGGNVVTGAGRAGIMGAAFRGALDGSRVEGAGENLTILRLPPWGEVDFEGGRAIGSARSEAARVEKFVRVAETLVVFPGGAGTSLELAKLVLMLAYPREDAPLPVRIVVVSSAYWSGLRAQLETQIQAGQLKPEVLSRFAFVDDREALLEAAWPAAGSF